MAAEESRDFLQAQGQGCPRCPVLLRLSCAGWAGRVGREGEKGGGGGRSEEGAGSGPSAAGGARKPVARGRKRGQRLITKSRPRHRDTQEQLGFPF